jgi:diaminopimelate decarboxylase
MVKAIAGALEFECRERDLPLPRLYLEPGRSLVGEAGLTLYTVGTRKEIPAVRTYVSVDGGMADNPRVALYQAEYTCALANRMLDEPEETVTIAGRFCESGDILIKDVRLPRARRGDILVVFSTGAYHYSMASNYNRVPRPAMVTVYQGEADLLVERETYADLTRLDRIPARYLTGAAVEAAASGSYRHEDGLAG